MFRSVLVLALIASATAASQEPPPLTLSEAVARALRAHPQLSAAQLEVDAHEAEAGQAARRPNPTTSLEIEDLARSSGTSRPSQTTFSVSQRIELGGKRGLRVAVADLSTEVARWDLRLTRGDLERRVGDAYVQALAATAAVALAQSEADTAASVSEAVKARVDAGIEAPPEGDRAAAAAGAARLTVLTAQRRQREALIELTSTWAGNAADAGAIEGRLDVVPLQPLAALEAAVDNAPVLQRWTAELARLARAKDLAASGGVPDVDIGAGYRRLHDTASHAWLIGASVAWPLFDRQRDLVAAADKRVNAGQSAREAARLDLLTALRIAHGQAEAAVTTVATIDRDVLPLQERAYAATMEGYTAGRFGLLQVLDARRGLFETRRLRLDGLTDLHQSLVVLHTLLGSTPNLAAPMATGESR
jgi:outer membrane protein, heavy metal efflux system